MLALTRRLLVGFDDQERADIVRDVTELAETRTGWRRATYFWIEIAKYPVRRQWDRAVSGVRGHTSRTGEGGTMERWLHDVRYAARSLVRSRGFSATALVILSLGMGATTAIYSVVDGVLLEPLPLDEPERVVSVWLHSPENGRARMTPGAFSAASAAGAPFESVAAFQGRSASLLLDDQATFVRGGAVTVDYFRTLGAHPLLGRTFDSDEAGVGAAPVVVISDVLWRSAFGGEPDIVGRGVSLDGVLHEVLGVIPASVLPTGATVSAELAFTTANQDFFVPLVYGPELWQNFRPHILGMVGRLRPGQTLATATAAVSAVDGRLHDEGLLSAEHLLMTSFADEVVGDVRLALWALLGTVGLVLSIAVVNVGALFVLRTDDRRSELAIRAALGASRVRILRQLMLESALVAIAAGVLAVGVARLALEGMRSLVPYQIPRLDDVTVSSTSLVVTFGLGLAVALFFALLPVLSSDRASTGRATRRRQTASRNQRRLQSALVAVQAALGVIVLAGAGLLTRSYGALRTVDTGFEARETWAMTVPAEPEVLDQVVAELRAHPSVAGAAVAYDHPLSRNWGDSFQVPDASAPSALATGSGSLRIFGSDYFEVAGIGVRAGRVPGPIEMAGERPFAVVNQALAEAWFPDGGAVGSTLIVPTAARVNGDDGSFEILGVVDNVRFLGPDQPVGPAFYLPQSHFAQNATTLLVRPAEGGDAVMGVVREVVARAAPGVAIQRPQRLSDIHADLIARPRFNMMLLVTFGAMVLVLCGLGAYGLVGRVVATRVREIGIRMALGARRAPLARSVMGSALRPMLVGGAAGLVVALGASGLIQSLLFGIGARDPLSLVLGPVFVVLVGATAAALPTLRALSIDPAASLREE